MAYYTRRNRRSLPFGARAVDWPLRPISRVFLLGITAVLLMGAILLISRPAWARGFQIETGSGLIKGHAQQARLGDVLNHLAQRNGYKVFIDEKLVSIPVTFDIPVALNVEKAIRRIVHPYSYAFVFTRLPENKGLRIDQIKVFSRGSQPSNYLLLTGDGSAPAISSSYVRGSSSAGASRNQVRAGRAAVGRHVKPVVEITKSSMGFTGFSFHDRRRGPDYTPNTLTLAKSYADYRKQRKALENRGSKAVLLDAQRKAEQEKMKWRSQRTASIQQTLDASQGRVKEEK